MARAVADMVKRSEMTSKAGKAMMDAVLVHCDVPRDQAEKVCIAGVKLTFPDANPLTLREMFNFYWDHCGGKL